MNAETNQQSPEPEDAVDYKSMHWKTLQALMKAEGQDWVNSKHAVAYLESLDKADAENKSNDLDAGSEPEAGKEPAAEKTADPDSEADPKVENTSSEEDVTDPDLDPDEDEDVVGDDDLVSDPEDDESEPCFDPDAPHGVVTGETNARYWQCGCHFDGQGKYIAPEDVK